MTKIKGISLFLLIISGAVCILSFLNKSSWAIGVANLFMLFAIFIRLDGK